MTIIQKKKKRLQVVEKEIAASACPLKKTATQAVPGEGNPDADILFIGEAPGRNEDATGRPFVGAAGKILDALLNSIDLKREDVFITSIEKFRPPNNRDPKPIEIMACFPFLEKQIQIIQPKIIVPLGRHALRRMLEWEKGEKILATISMQAYHGKVIRGKKGYVYYPVLHPAAVLYNRKLEQTLQKEFKRIRFLLKKSAL